MSFYSPQSARKPPGRNKRMSVCAMATSPTYAFSPTAQKAQLEPLSQESRYIHYRISLRKLTIWSADGFEKLK